MGLLRYVSLTLSADLKCSWKEKKSAAENLPPIPPGTLLQGTTPAKEPTCS